MLDPIPYVPMDDDSVCCQCHKPLPNDPIPGSWNDSGFCGPSCCLAFNLTYATFPHEPSDNSVLSECVKALSAITHKNYYACDNCGYVYDSLDVPPVPVSGNPDSLYCQDCDIIMSKLMMPNHDDPEPY